MRDIFNMPRFFAVSSSVVEGSIIFVGEFACVLCLICVDSSAGTDSTIFTANIILALASFQSSQHLLAGSTVFVRDIVNVSQFNPSSCLSSSFFSCERYGTA